MCCWGHLIGGKTAARLGIEYPSWYGVQAIWDEGYAVRDMRFGIWDLGYAIWDEGYAIWDLGYPVLVKF